MLFAAMGNQSNSNLKPGMPMGTQLTHQLLSSLMGEQMAGTFSPMIGPEVNKALYGSGPFAGFGGMGSQYNYASRMTQYSQELFTKSFKQEVNAQTTRENEAQYLEMMQKRLGKDYREKDVRAGMGTDWQYLAIAGLNATVGSGQVAYGVRDTATSLGYTFGSGFDFKDDKWGKDNSRILGNVRKMSEEMMSSYSKEGYKYGNLTGRDTGDLIREMGKRGELKELGSSETDSLNTDNIKQKIQNTSRSLSGIRDIIKGSIPEVLKQLESAFGGDSMNTLGVEKIAHSLQKYRQLSETTGTSLTDMMQYAQAAGAITQQVAGYSQNASGAGLTISAFQAAGTGGDTRGINSSAYANTSVQRITGAQISETSLMVSGALALIKEKGGDASDFKRKLSDSTSPLSASVIAQLSGLSTSEVINASNSRAARDMMSEDSTGTFAALANSKKYFGGARKDLLQRHLKKKLGDGTLGEGISDIDASLAANMNQRELEATYGVDQVGKLTTTLDDIAKSAGFDQGADAQVKFYNTQDRAARLEKLSGIKATWAKEIQMVGGSVSAMVRNAGGGGNILNKDWSKSLSSLTNIMTKEGFMSEATGADLHKALGSKESLDRMKAFINEKDSEGGTVKTTRSRIVDQEYEKLLAIEPNDPRFRQQLQDMQEPDFWKKREKDYKQTLKGSVEFSNKGRDYESMSYEEKQTAIKDFTKTRAEKLFKEKGVWRDVEVKDANGKVIMESDGLGGKKAKTEKKFDDFSPEIMDAMKLIAGESKPRRPGESEADYTKRLASENTLRETAIKQQAGNLAGDKDSIGKDILEKGVTKDITVIAQDILTVLVKFFGGDKTAGTGDAPKRG